jgi:hypothetical protein
MSGPNIILVTLVTAWKLKNDQESSRSSSTDLSTRGDNAVEGFDFAGMFHSPASILYICSEQEGRYASRGISKEEEQEEKWSFREDAAVIALRSERLG